MKYLGPVFIVVALLLSAAVFYKLTTPPAPTGLPFPEEGHVQALVTPPVVPSANAAASGTLRLDAALSHSYLARSQNHVFASIDVTAGDVRGTDRAAVNVALVIDRSGSMIGRPIEDAKLAAQDFVNRLRNGDSVSIVSFSDHARVDFPAQKVTAESRQEIHRAIQRIHANGGTNISDGFERGVGELRRTHEERSIDRIILLTDGHPNYGKTATRDLVELAREHQRMGVAMTAIGFGLNYNEDLMASMADAGGGNYYFARDQQAVATAFATEFQQLNSIVARRTMVRVELGDQVQVVDVYGYPFEREGRFVEIPLSEFYGGQNKSILIKLNARASAPGSLPIVDVRLRYEETMQEREVSQRVSLAAVVTDDSKLLEQGLNTQVLTRVEEIEIAKSMEVAMTQYQSGKAEEAERTIREQKKRTASARKIYNLPEAKFQAASASMDETITTIRLVPANTPAARGAVMENKAQSRSVRQSRQSGW